MKFTSIASILILLLGVFSIFSSIYSVPLASEYRYQKLVERSQNNPESVSADEWVKSKDDEGITGLSLIIVGAISFFILTTGVFLTLMARNCKKLSSAAFSFGVSWILLGIALHTFVWLT